MIRYRDFRKLGTIAIVFGSSIAHASGEGDRSHILHRAQTTNSDLQDKAELSRTQLEEIKQEILRFGRRANALAPAQQLDEIDIILKKLKNLTLEAAGTPYVGQFQLLNNRIEEVRRIVAHAVSSQPNSTQHETPGGPYTDFERLTQLTIMALSNPIRRDSFVASLARGIDFNVGIYRIVSERSGYLLQFWGGQNAPPDPGQGFFCRIPSSDSASLSILGSVTPPYAVVRASANQTDEVIVSGEPLRIRVVFGGCRITTMDSGGSQGRAP